MKTKILLSEALRPLNYKDKNLFLEAYRRWMMFHEPKKATLQNAWIGLGTPSSYKSNFFKTFDGNTTPRINHWYVFSESGIKIMKQLLKEVPLPKNLAERSQLNSELFK